MSEVVQTVIPSPSQLPAFPPLITSSCSNQPHQVFSLPPIDLSPPRRTNTEKSKVEDVVGCSSEFN